MRYLALTALTLLLAAACSSGDGSGARDGSAGDGAERESGTYLAMGDSLSAGIGSSNWPEKGFVPLVHGALGDGYELLNLGIFGDTSDDLVAGGPLELAEEKIAELDGDDDPANDVTLITLEIGGNDLLALVDRYVLTGRCPSVDESLDEPECVDALRTTLNDFEANLTAALDRLAEAAPEATIVVATLYNPHSGGQPVADALRELALEGKEGTEFPEGMNDTIRARVEERGLVLADWHPLFEGRSNEYIFLDGIHPNDTGHLVLANAVLEALGREQIEGPETGGTEEATPE